MKLTPHPEQELVIQQILRDKHTLLKADVGSGKTLCGVEAALRSEAEVVLVIGPLATFTGWERTFSSQTSGGAVLRFIDGRKAGKEAHTDLAMGIPGYYFVGHERARGQSWKDWELDFVIADEVHRIANRNSKSFKMLSTMQAEYKVGLSATPAANKPEGLWAVGRWHWPDKKIIDNSFWRFCTEHLKEEYDPYSYKKYGGEIVPGSILKSFPSVAVMKSRYDGKPAVHNIEVELNPTQRRIYKELEQDAIAWLDENPLVAELPSVKYIRLLETTLATPSVEQVWDEEEMEFKDRVYFEPDAKSSKLDAVLDVLADLQAEKPEPVIIYTHSRKFADFLVPRIAARKHSVQGWTGGQTQEERSWKLDNFGKEFSVLVATISSIGEGTDGIQRVCANEIWVSVSDNGILNTQTKGRLSRQGQEKKVNRFIVQAKDTVELKQKDRLKTNYNVLAETLGEQVEV